MRAGWQVAKPKPSGGEVGVEREGLVLSHEDEARRVDEAQLVEVPPLAKRFIAA